MGRVAEFNIAIILDPGQLTTYKNISKFKNKLNTEFNNYLDLIVWNLNILRPSDV